jgi:predicted nuclease of predicted toxin-antitoxin system
MKLLFDQNLSPRLVERLASIYPGSSHVEKVGLGKELDRIESMSQDPDTGILTLY